MQIWVFGYGSLVWRVGFPYAERRPARVEGFARRFWQGSIDHRGVPGAPGRVVTLIPEAGARCVGMAYRLPPQQADSVLDALDHRERGGYQRLDLDLRFLDDGGGGAPGLAYVATPENPNYLGPAPLEEIAEQVRRSRGPSGPNPEYVFRLAEFVREHDGEDEHVLELARLLLGGS